MIDTRASLKVVRNLNASRKSIARRESLANKITTASIVLAGLVLIVGGVLDSLPIMMGSIGIIVVFGMAAVLVQVSTEKIQKRLNRLIAERDAFKASFSL